MDAPLIVLLTNAAMAGLLSLLAWVAARTIRRQAVVHALWLLALLKLVAPPIAPLPVLPAWQGLRLTPAPPAPTFVAIPTPAVLPATWPVSLEPASSLRGETVVGGTPAAAATAIAPPWRVAKPPRFDGRAGWLVLALGALIVAVLTAWRFVRFGRLLTYARPAPKDLTDRASALAVRIGLRRAPPVVLVPSRIPPMLWPGRAGPTLLLPERLLPGLGEDELDTLIAHELAHVRRRDHWVRLVEIAATTLFWWYPVAWWARRALRRAEERCCDEWVLRVFPTSAPAYANGLLKSLTFVAGEPGELPAVASGAGPVEDLEARLKEILMTRPLPRLTVPLRLALAAAAALGLALFPTHAQPSAAVDPTQQAQPTDEVPARAAPAARPTPAVPPTAPTPVSRRPTARPAVHPAPPPVSLPVTAAPVMAPPVAAPPAVAAAQAESASDAARRALEDKRRSLEVQRVRLEQEQLALARQRMELEARAEQEQLRAEAEQLRAQGEAEQAAFVDKQADATARRADIQRRQLELEAKHMAVEAQLEESLHEKAARSEALAREGHDAEAADLEREMERVNAEQESATQKVTEEQQALEREMEQETKRMEELSAEEEVMHLREATRELSRSLAEQIEALRQSLERLGPKRAEAEAEIRRLEKALFVLQETAKP